MTNNSMAFTADFVDFRRVKTRPVFQIILEIDESMGDAALQRLGGFPRSGESRPVAVAVLQDQT